MGRSAFEKFVGGAAEAGADYTGKLINDRLELARQERLKMIGNDSAMDLVRRKAAFDDENYDRDQTRELGLYEEKKKIDSRYREPRENRDDKPEIKKYGSTKDELGNVIDQYATYDYDQKAWLDVDTGQPIGVRKDPKSRFFANNPKATEEDWERILAERTGKADPKPEPPPAGSVIDKATKMPESRVDAVTYAGDPESAAEVVQKIKDGTLDAWRRHGMDVEQYLSIGRTLAGRADRKIIDQYLDRLK